MATNVGPTPNGCFTMADLYILLSSSPFYVLLLCNNYVIPTTKATAAQQELKICLEDDSITSEMVTKLPPNHQFRASLLIKLLLRRDPSNTSDNLHLM